MIGPLITLRIILDPKISVTVWAGRVFKKYFFNAINFGKLVTLMSRGEIGTEFVKSNKRALHFV